MPLFTKKAPPIWYVLYPNKSSNPDAQPTREGPYTRDSVIKLLAQDKLSGGALIWTNEKIFPNPERPNSSRLVRIEEWRRFDQLPDPVTREFQLQAQHYRQTIVTNVPAEHEQQPPPPVPTPSEIQRIQNDVISHPPPPPPDEGGQHLTQNHPPPAQSIYPAGAFTSVNSKNQDYPIQTPQQDSHLPGAYPKPSGYPGGIYPQ